MPEYILELKVRNDKLKRGSGRNGATYQTTRSNKHSGDVATWSFYSTDSGETIRDVLESVFSGFAGVAYVD